MRPEHIRFALGLTKTVTTTVNAVTAGYRVHGMPGRRTRHAALRHTL